MFSRHRRPIKIQAAVGKYRVLGTARWQFILQHVIQGQIVPQYILHPHREAVLPGKIKIPYDTSIITNLGVFMRIFARRQLQQIKHNKMIR